VVIQSPTAVIALDGDAKAAGIQTDVQVRSTLLPNEEIELIVLDAIGAEVGRRTLPASAGGMTVFAGVTMPLPHASLRVTASSTCGLAGDAAEVDVIAGTGCDLVLTPMPQAVQAYPAGVLNVALDPEPASGFQASLAVTTRTGFAVELLANKGSGEQMVAQVNADNLGIARFAQSLVDGPVSFRAVCKSPGNELVPSAAVTAQVDITPPTCDIANPAPGSTITPDMDLDNDLSNGVQLVLEAQVAGGDATGEPAELIVASTAGAISVQMSPVDPQGVSTAAVTFPLPGTYDLVLVGRDRAGNPCESSHTYNVSYDGCSINVVAPTSTVTADADGIPANGSQADIQVAVSSLCEGRTVTGACGLTPLSGTVTGGALLLHANLCGTSPCEAQALCTFSVTSPAGVQTQTTTTIAFDDLGPTVSVAVIQPQLACGSQITPTTDVDPVTPGVQVTARVTSSGLVPKLTLTNSGGTSTVSATSDATVTLASGLNLLTGGAEDAYGNHGQSAACTLSLADMLVAVDAPADDGFVGRADGTISGGALTFPLCGTVDRTGAAVSVRVDGGAPISATVTGTSWCVTLSLAEAAHTVTVNATKGASFGLATLPLAVDLTPPGAVTDPTGIASTRRSVRLQWTAPADGSGPVASYIAKVSTTPLTEANFDAQGTAIAVGAPRAPGLAEAADVTRARLGTQYWLGVASVDRAGNRAAAAIFGPVSPAWDQLGPILGPNRQQGNLAMGAAIAHGKLNDDELDDLVVAAPTQDAGGLLQAGAVYVYFGRPGGPAATPDVTILGGAAGAQAGAGLAAVRWSGATRDDLVIGAPGAAGGAGRLFVFRGGAAFPAGTVVASSAPLQLGVSAASPGWFAGGRLGAAAAAADVDGDGTDDLVASAPGGGGGSGGIVVFYGGTVTASVVLSDVDPSGVGGAVVQYMPDPLSLGHNFGTYLHAVEPTRGQLDTDDDLVVGYADQITSRADSVYVLRGNGTRPAPGLSLRPFTVGRDVRIDFTSATNNAELGAQAISIPDENDDGAAELVISAYRDASNMGQVYVIDGDVVGTGGVARATDAGVVLTSIRGVSGMRLGAVLIARDAQSVDDIDGDGGRDLAVGGLQGGSGRLFVWFGGTLPSGLTSTATAGTSIAGPTVFAFNNARPQGPAGQGRWVGDLNGDGLDDVCWASPYDNSTSLDGAFAILLDLLP
jgi:hypothetical protein